jgi:hypothetical protein
MADWIQHRLKEEALSIIDEDDLQSIMADEVDAEIYETLVEETIPSPFDPLYGPGPESCPTPSSFVERIYKRLLEEFPDYESEHGPRKVLGWTIAKRRRIRESVKNFKDNRLMRCAIAATCKSLYNVNAKRTEMQTTPEFAPEFGKRELHFKDAPSTKKVWEVLVREWS